MGFRKNIIYPEIRDFHQLGENRTVEKSGPSGNAKLLSNSRDLGHSKNTWEPRHSPQKKHKKLLFEKIGPTFVVIAYMEDIFKVNFFIYIKVL